MEKVPDLDKWLNGIRNEPWQNSTTSSTQPEPIVPTKFTFKGPVISDRQFFYALSLYAISPELANGRLQETKLITAIDGPEFTPKFHAKTGSDLILDSNGIPLPLSSLINQPYGSNFLNAISKLEIEWMIVWRQLEGITDRRVTVKEFWDFKSPRVVLHCDASHTTFDLCPPSILDAYIIGSGCKCPIIGIDVVFECPTRNLALIETYRSCVLPRVLNWANGSDESSTQDLDKRLSNYVSRIDSTDEVGDQISDRLVELQPSPSPPFYDMDGMVKSTFSFLHAMSVFATKPHVLNKRVKGSELVVDSPEDSPKFYAEREGLLVLLSWAEVPFDLYEALKEPLTKSVIDDLLNFGVKRMIIQRRVLGKSMTEYISYEDWDLASPRVLIEYQDNEQGLNEFPPLIFDSYMIAKNHVRMMIGVSGKRHITNCDSLLKSIEFFHTNALTKVLKWAKVHISVPQPDLIPAGSLKYVPVKGYYELYERMKATLFHELKKIWTESTDPLKFIPEEIGISAYVKCYIDSVSDGQQWNFVDVGCGNGVLTFVLADAGEQGYGFDIRPRKIWEHFHKVGVQPSLRVKSFNPFLDGIDYQKNLWLIGNHCDELTPWIAIMARRSRAVGFIIIPCCFYDFHGKFQRKSSKGNDATYNPSRYHNYIHYIAEIGKKCGYEICVDKLRIPSTKRICIIGLDNFRYNSNLASGLEFQNAMKYADSKVTEFPSPDDSIGNIIFKPRSPVERVNNCTQLNKEMIAKVVKRIFDMLLSKKELVSVPEYIMSWNRGHVYRLNLVVQFLTADERDAIKSQGKGLQTVLKNHSQIFIIENGIVRLRCPIIDDRTLKNQFKVKTRNCYFHLHHPDGCPLSSEACRFKHPDYPDADD